MTTYNLSSSQSDRMSFDADIENQLADFVHAADEASLAGLSGDEIAALYIETYRDAIAAMVDDWEEAVARIEALAARLVVPADEATAVGADGGLTVAEIDAEMAAELLAPATEILRQAGREEGLAPTVALQEAARLLFEVSTDLPVEVAARIGMGRFAGQLRALARRMERGE